MGELLTGRVEGADERGILVRIPYDNWQRFSKRRYEECLVEFADGRKRSPEQNRMAWELMTDIATGMGDGKEYVYDETRRLFAARSEGELQQRLFHLSDATVEEASRFIALLIDIIIEFGYPTKHPLYQYADDIDRYVYSCLRNKRCAICNRERIDLHHCDRVGMGRNRKQIIHEGMKVLPLCRIHHMECHGMSQEEFDSRYHIHGIPATKDICKIYGLKAETD